MLKDCSLDVRLFRFVIAVSNGDFCCVDVGVVSQRYHIFGGSANAVRRLRTGLSSVARPIRERAGGSNRGTGKAHLE